MSARTKDIDEVVCAWKRSGFRGEFTVDALTCPRPARTGDLLVTFHPSVKSALKIMGIERPYTHQVEAWWHLISGRSAVIATPTASGKTLCYNAPVVDALLKDPDATALYMFPTKALARDQERAIRELCAAAGLHAAPAVYDGDTPAAERRAIKRESRIIITNPDMLHTAILPHHASFARFLGGLKFAVVDELHGYRGVFGAHVANVLRRLKRVCGFHGSRPVFAACSATIGNPSDLAQALAAERFELVSESGAAAGARRFVVYNPEIVDQIVGLRRSALKVSAKMSASLAAAGLTTIVFCQTRRAVEMLLKDVRERLESKGMDPGRARGYRGGYLPTLRREIEGALKAGAVDVVVATNALELGIDVGELDAVVLAGYPGTIASTHQRAGRAGRRRTPSLAVLVASGKPLDQFLAREPRYLTEANPELALVQPDNVDILLGHLKCAAFELPFARDEAFGPVPAADTLEALGLLADEGVLTESGGRFHYVASDYPAADLSLRDMGGKRVVIVDMDSGAPLGEVDPVAARHDLHADAVYQHEGLTYHVERLDQERAEAHVRRVDPVYYTTPVVHDALEVLDERARKALSAGVAACGDVRVVSNVTGFKKSRFKTNENLGYGDVTLPPLSLETEGVWITTGPEPAAPVRDLSPPHLAAGFEALSHLLLQTAALRLMCDPRDLRATVQLAPPPKGSDEEAFPVLYVYDAHSGGIGLSERAYAEMGALLRDCLSLVEGCPCENGCPVCVGPPDLDGPPIKRLAALLTETLLTGMETP